MRLVTTHDWASPVDVDHLASVRADIPRFAAGGIDHLVLEVIAYALDEAAEGSTRSIDVTLHDDGSVAVLDDGRGTDTRRNESGSWMVKPIMATADLRFHGSPDAPLLPDGLPRRGMSVVAAMCSRVEHLNVRAEGAWAATYEHGLPVGSPRPAPHDGPSGTTVRIWPDSDVFGNERLDVDRLRAVTDTVETTASVTVS